MNEVEQARNLAEADAFFAQFVDASQEIIQRVTAEREGNLTSVMAEDRAFGYWDRKIAARAARRAAREQAEHDEQARRLATLERFAHPVEGARLAPLSEASAALLPAPRRVTLTDAEVAETARWWQRLERESTARVLAARIRRQIRDAGMDQRRAARAAATWRLDERAFERAQWLAVIARRDARPAKKIANRWVVIAEDRALAIAIAALEKHTPPQGRK